MLTGNFSEKDEDEINIQDIDSKDFQNLINFIEYYYEVKGKKIKKLKEEKRMQKLKENNNSNNSNNIVNVCENNINLNDINDNKDENENENDDKLFEAEVENEETLNKIINSEIEFRINKNYSFIHAANQILGLIECADRYLIDDLKEYTKEWLLEVINNQSQDIDLLIFIYTRILSLFRYNKNFKEILDECVKNILMNFIKITQNFNSSNTDKSISDNTSIPLLRWNKILLFKSDFIHRSIKLLYESDYYNTKMA